MRGRRARRPHDPRRPRRQCCGIGGWVLVRAASARIGRRAARNAALRNAVDAQIDDTVGGTISNQAGRAGETFAFGSVGAVRENRARVRAGTGAR